MIKKDTNNINTLPLGKRQQFIPINKSEIVDLLCEEGNLNSEQIIKFKIFCKILEHVFHKEFYEKTNILKKTYNPLNPDSDIVKLKNFSKQEVDKNAKIFIQKLEEILIASNYEKVTPEELKYALKEKSLFKVNLIVDFDEFQEFLLYKRGESSKEIEIQKFFGLKKEKITIQVYDKVVLYIRFKDEDYLINKELGKFKYNSDDKFINIFRTFLNIFKTKKKEKVIKNLQVSPSSSALKLFKNIPKADIEMLFPNTRIFMTMKDTLTIGIPAVIGTISAFLSKFLTAIIGLFGVIVLVYNNGSFPDKVLLTKAVSGFATMGAFLAYISRQYGKYKSKKINFMKKLSENLYFRNLDNNQGVFTYLIDSAEEQEFKETVLSYYFLLLEKSPITSEQLDEKIEQWIFSKTNMDIDFEMPDAIRKLKEFNLLDSETDKDITNEKYSVISLDESLKRLDYLWDNYFVY